MQLSRLVAVVVVVLLGGVAVWAVRPEAVPQVRPPTPSTAVSSTAVPSTTSLPPKATRPASESEPPISGVRVEAGDPAAVVSEGLAAWGRFAVSGDLAEVDGLFASGGPQMGQFEAEATDLATDSLEGPPYTVTFTEEERAVSGEEARLSGIIRFVRTGEPTQSFDWTLVLRKHAGEWSIWTVEESDDETG